MASWVLETNPLQCTTQGNVSLGLPVPSNPGSFKTKNFSWQILKMPVNMAVQTPMTHILIFNSLKCLLNMDSFNYCSSAFSRGPSGKDVSLAVHSRLQAGVLNGE